MPSPSRSRAAVILAAGQGTRMKASLPKVLHPVGGRAMLDHAIDTAEALGCERVVVVTGARDGAVARHAEARLGTDAVAVQDPPHGTGHAVRMAEAALEGFEGDVVVLYGDTPLMRPEVVQPVFELRDAGADLAVLGFDTAAPGAYGRLIMTTEGVLLRIVEAKDATENELAVRHCNSGVLAADWPLLRDLMAEVRDDNANGEFYLTDVVGLARARELSARVAFASEDSVMGVNSQAELAVAERLYQSDLRRRALGKGVRMTAPETVFLAHDTDLAGGAVIEPNVVFGPGVRVETGAVIRAFSHLEQAVVREGAVVGPYARLRPGADIGPDAHVGNFVEVKNTTLGPGAKANHLAYLGDGEVGAKANIGAGVIFCNYDGFGKYRTVIGEGAFVGSDCALVAPVTIGAGAMTGSGSVISQDVAPDALALERSPQVEKAGWAAAFRERKRAEKAGR